MFLTARALGFGVMWKTGGPAYDPALNVDIGLLADDQIVAFLYLGTTETENAVRPQNVSEAAIWL